MLVPLKWLQYGRFPDIVTKFVRVVFWKSTPGGCFCLYCILYFFFLTAVVFHGIRRKCLKDTSENTFPWLSTIIYLIKNYRDFCYVLGSSNPFLVNVLFLYPTLFPEMTRNQKRYFDVFREQESKIQKQSLADDLQNISVLKSFAIFTVKHLFWSLFVIYLQAWGSNTGALLGILQNIYKQLFYRTPPVPASKDFLSRSTFYRVLYRLTFILINLILWN